MTYPAARFNCSACPTYSAYPAYPAYPAYQSGVAVIMVLLVLAIVAVTTAALVKRHQFNQAMASQVIHLGQAKSHIQGAEHWVQLMLQQDRQDNNIDHQGEAWAQAVPPPACGTRLFSWPSG